MADAKAIWAAANAAAVWLGGLDHPRIDLGTVEQLEELAALAGAKVTVTLYVGPNEPAPRVCESVWAELGRVSVNATRWRAARPGDEALGVVHRTGEVGRAATPGEVRAALAVSPPESPDNCASDCATHNEPAEPNGPCDCGAAARVTP